MFLDVALVTFLEYFLIQIEDVRMAAIAITEAIKIIIFIVFF